jgi:hypothetical protein
VDLARARRRAASATIWRVVLPRTIESSTTTIDLPPTISGSGLNFIRRPCLRSSCPAG